MFPFRAPLWRMLSLVALVPAVLADVPNDADHDGDVDFTDFVTLAECQLGPGNPAAGDCQEAFDAEFDFDVDLADIAGFQRCFSGADQPADADCLGHVTRIEDGCLHIIGTAAGSPLALRLRFGAPSLLDIDVGNDGSPDFTFIRSLIGCIVIDARGGDDVVFIDESNGAFTNTIPTRINGGSGDDSLIGGSGGETFDGGPGDDAAFMGPGDDRIVWNPGDGTDLVEGAEGSDTIEINGSDAGESFSISANGARVRFDRLDPAPFALDISGVEDLVLQANGGNDLLSCVGNLAALIRITADGGAGDDTLRGGNGADVLIGGDDNDFIDGNQGNDLILLGAGDDSAQWDPGDGSDTVEGAGGHDVMNFNGSNGAETLDLSTNGARLRLARNLGNIVMDIAGVEQVELRMLGSPDVVNTTGLAGSGVSLLDIDLGATGGIGDAQADVVNILGGPGADTFDVFPDGGFTRVALAAEVRVKGYELADTVRFSGTGGDRVNLNGSAGADTFTVVSNGAQARADVSGYSTGFDIGDGLALRLNGLEGSDSFSSAGNLAGLNIPLTFDGGPGDDTILGSNGADLLIGGDGDDFVDGNQGGDQALLGTGTDTFQWDPGDGNDTIEGQGDDDVLLLNASNANEIVDLSPNGERLRLTRNIGNIILDAGGVERVELLMRGGTDAVVVNDLSTTAVGSVDIDLSNGSGAGDAAADSVTVNGTDSADVIDVSAVAGAVEVSGLSARVHISHSEAANDRLFVNGLGGADTITPGPGLAELIQVSLIP